jgi:hypothetical protein
MHDRRTTLFDPLRQESSDIGQRQLHCITSCIRLLALLVTGPTRCQSFLCRWQSIRAAPSHPPVQRTSAALEQTRLRKRQKVVGAKVPKACRLTTAHFSCLISRRPPERRFVTCRVIPLATFATTRGSCAAASSLFTNIHASLSWMRKDGRSL